MLSSPLQDRLRSKSCVLTTSALNLEAYHTWRSPWAPRRFIARWTGRWERGSSQRVTSLPLSLGAPPPLLRPHMNHRRNWALLVFNTCLIEYDRLSRYTKVHVNSLRESPSRIEPGSVVAVHSSSCGLSLILLSGQGWIFEKIRCKLVSRLDEEGWKFLLIGSLDGRNSLAPLLDTNRIKAFVLVYN